MKEISHRSACPISFTLDFFGDKWTLLILRDMIIKNKTTFAEFQQSDEGIASNILTNRLKMLEGYGFVFKYPVQGKSRTAYFLTPKGITIVPIIIEMALWGAAQGYDSEEKELAKSLKKNKESTLKSLSRNLTKKYKLIVEKHAIMGSAVSE